MASFIRPRNCFRENLNPIRGNKTSPNQIRDRFLVACHSRQRPETCAGICFSASVSISANRMKPKDKRNDRSYIIYVWRSIYHPRTRPTKERKYAVRRGNTLTSHVWLDRNGETVRFIESQIIALRSISGHKDMKSDPWKRLGRAGARRVFSLY